MLLCDCFCVRFDWTHRQWHIRTHSKIPSVLSLQNYGIIMLAKISRDCWGGERWGIARERFRTPTFFDVWTVASFSTSLSTKVVGRFRSTKWSIFSFPCSCRLANPPGNDPRTAKIGLILLSFVVGEDGCFPTATNSVMMLDPATEEAEMKDTRRRRIHDDETIFNFSWALILKISCDALRLSWTSRCLEISTPEPVVLCLEAQKNSSEKISHKRTGTCRRGSCLLELQP